MLEEVVKKIKNILFCGDDDVFIISFSEKKLIII